MKYNLKFLSAILQENEIFFLQYAGNSVKCEKNTLPAISLQQTILQQTITAFLKIVFLFEDIINHY